MDICILHSFFWFGHWFFFWDRCGVTLAWCCLYYSFAQDVVYFILFIYLFTEGLGVSRIGTLKMLRYPFWLCFFLPLYFYAENGMGWTGYICFSGRGQSTTHLSGRLSYLVLIAAVFRGSVLYIYYNKIQPVCSCFGTVTCDVSEDRGE